jgi:hypothetical protein
VRRLFWEIEFHYRLTNESVLYEKSRKIETQKRRNRKFSDHEMNSVKGGTLITTTWNWITD